MTEVWCEPHPPMIILSSGYTTVQRDMSKSRLLDNNFEQELVSRYKASGPNFDCSELVDTLNAVFRHVTATRPVSPFVKFRKQLTLSRLYNTVQRTTCDASTPQVCPIPSAQFETNAKRAGCDPIHLYETPFKGAVYPFGLCVRSIATAMEFVDLAHIEANGWDEKLTSVYFHSRYVYYLEYLLGELPDVIIWPTVEALGATDLLKLRATRFQPCGITFKPSYVDEAMQSPLNFFYHDINHPRRIHQNNKWYARRNNLNLDELFTTMKQCRDRLIPLNPKFQTRSALVKMILFETVHEDALPFLPAELIRNIKLQAGACYPYEASERATDNLERITRRFYRQGATTLATLYNKLRHQFFEDKEAIDIIVPAHQRTMNELATAAAELLLFLHPTQGDQNSLIQSMKKLICDQRYAHHSTSNDRMARMLGGLEPDPEFDLCMARFRSTRWPTVATTSPTPPTQSARIPFKKR